MANWHYCTWAKDSNTIRALFIDLLKHFKTFRNLVMYDDKRCFINSNQRKRKQKQWIKTLICVRGQIRQPAEMRVGHLHCAIMYSKWLHKCFFLSLKKRKMFKKKKKKKRKIFIVEASLKVSLCYPFRGDDVRSLTTGFQQLWTSRREIFQDIKK